MENEQQVYQSQLCNSSSTLPYDSRALLSMAVDIIIPAGQLAAKQQKQAMQSIQYKSSTTDIVTQIDRDIEQFIVQAINRSRPGDIVLGEEFGSHLSKTSDKDVSDSVRWIVDPIDGTVNYVHGLPQWAVSIGIEVSGCIVAGAVYNPVTQQLWTALATSGAWCNEVKISGSHREELATAVIGTGFSYQSEIRARQAEVVAALLPQVADIRRLGAAALDLCFAASGFIDAYYERHVKLWDVAAGALIAQEAGLTVGTLDGLPLGNPSGGIMVADSRLMPVLRDAVSVGSGS